MMCFRDITFCKSDCNVEKCHRKYTKQVKDDARKWWGKDGAPIAISDFSKGCPDYRE